MNNKECHTNCYETLLVCKVFSWNSFIVFVDPAMSWPNEVNSCNAIGYPSSQILKPQTGTQMYDCKVFFCCPQENLRQARKKFVGILALTFSVLDPLQTSGQFMQLNVPLFPASEKVLIGKAHWWGPACMLGRSLWSILWPPVFFLDNQAWLVWPGLKDTDRECQNMPVHNCSNLSQYKTYSFCIAWVLWNCYYCVCFTLKKQAAIHFI